MYAARQREYCVSVWTGRHPSTAHFENLFAFDHLPAHLQLVSKWASMLAEEMVRKLPDGPELSAGLRKLLEAKDCFVRCAVAAGRLSMGQGDD
jgi:hypothetical protein